VGDVGGVEFGKCRRTGWESRGEAGEAGGRASCGDGLTTSEGEEWGAGDGGVALHGGQQKVGRCM